MKGKQLFLLLVLAIALGGAWFLVSQRNQASWSETGGGGGKVITFPINDVGRVVIKTAGAELNLVKKADEWTVKERADYPASFEQVSGLLRKLWDLKTVQEVKVGPSQLPRLELIDPGKSDKSGTLVQLLGADNKILGALLIGKKHFRQGDTGGMDLGGNGFPVGRYVKLQDGAKVSLVAEIFEEVDPKPERWLARDFIKVESPKSIAVTGPQTWTVTRESATAEWKLAGAKPEEKLDSAKTSALGNVLSAPSFTDVQAPGAKLEEPITTANIDTFDGLHYELKIGQPTGDNYSVLVKVNANFTKERTPGKDEKPEDKTKLDGEFTTKLKGFAEKLAREKKMEGRPYLVAKSVVDPLLQSRDALLAPKPAELPKPTEPPKPAASVTTPPLPVPPPPAPAPPSGTTVTTPPITVPLPAPTTPPPAPGTPKTEPPVPATPPPKSTPAPPTGGTDAPPPPPAEKP